MGFLGNLVKRFVRKVVNKTSDRVVNNAAEKVSNKLFNGEKAYNTSKNYVNQVKEETKKVSVSAMPQYFEELLKQHFNDFEIKKDVSVIGGYIGKPYTFGLFKDGKVVAFIMLTNHNRDNNRAFLNAREGCKKEKVPFINFYTHFPNEEDYVVNRIKSFIK